MAKNGRISIKGATLMALSAVVGSTIFVITGVPLHFAGYLAIPIFIVVGLLSLLFALEFGELSSDMPNEKGVIYSYVNRSFGSELGLITGVLLYTAYCSTIAAISLSFGSYVASLLGFASAALPFSILLIISIAAISFSGIKNSMGINYMLIIFTLGVIALFAIYAFARGMSHGFPFANFYNSQQQNGIGSLFEASTVMVFAFAGFQTITSFTKDIYNKGRGAAKAMISAVAIGIAAYVLVAFSLILLVPAPSFGTSANPLLFALESSGAPFFLRDIVSIGAAVAIAAAVLVITITASRLIYQISKDGLLPPFFRSYEKRRDIAKNGIITTAIASVLLLFSGNVYIIASISNFGLIFSWLMASFTLISRRRRGRRPDFMAPLYPALPVAATFAALLFMVGMPQESLTIGIIMILLLIITYYFIVEFKQRRAPRLRLFK